MVEPISFKEKLMGKHAEPRQVLDLLKETDLSLFLKENPRNTKKHESRTSSRESTPTLLRRLQNA